VLSIAKCEILNSNLINNYLYYETNEVRNMRNMGDKNLLSPYNLIKRSSTQNDETQKNNTNHWHALAY